MYRITGHYPVARSAECGLTMMLPLRAMLLIRLLAWRMPPLVTMTGGCCVAVRYEGDDFA
jgi:hypothetical protein